VKNPIKQRYYDSHKKEIWERSTKYRKTPRGYLTWVYQNMKKRVTGKDAGKEHLYEGLDLLSTTTFAAWSLADVTFIALFKGWAEKDFVPYGGPSIDRIDSRGGYVLGNMRWITHSENSRLGAVSRWAA
jgi:hypothetical protein